MISKIFRGYSCIAIILIVTPYIFSDVRSQTVRIEPVLTYEYGYPLTIERAPGIINHFGTNGLGKSYDHTLGIGVALKLPDFFTSSIGLFPQLQYRFSLGNFTSEQYRSITAVDGNDQPIASTNTFEVVSKIQSLDLSLPVGFFLGNTGLCFGPWGSIEIARNITGTENITSPSNAHFRGGGVSQTFASGDTISTSHLHGGLEAGLSMEFPISASIAIEPFLYSRVDLSVISAASAKAISIGLSFSLSPIAAEQIQLPPDIPKIVAPAPKITASIHFAKNGTRIDRHSPIDVTGYSTMFRQYTEYLPEIYFDEGSKRIPAGYTQLNASQALQYSISSLANKSLDEYEKSTLNILAIRMKNDSLSGITLTASYTNSENKGLAQMRAESVKDYLTNVWRIEAKRISIVTAKTAQKPSVSFSPSDQSITAPVATQWIERSFHIPHMGIEKNITAEAGLRSWDIAITQNEKSLSHFSSNVPPAQQSFADFDLLGDPDQEGNSHQEVAPLVASLKVEDFAGRSAEARDTLTLPTASDLEKNTTQHKGFIFIFLQRPAGDSLHKMMQELLFQKLLTNVQAGAHITITNPVSLQPDAVTGQSIAERIVSSLALRPELGADVHIVQRSESKDQSDPYEQSIVVRIEQAKNDK
jgi:hypothetical protein